jgi:hypothetical protein
MYGKLFASMFDGTLATKGPWQALVTFQQLLILCDPTGMVDMTPEAISRRTTVPLEIIQAGIEALEQPDPDSRLPKENGRRIVRLSEHRSWGWQIVNHAHYKAMRTPADRREYMRNYQRDRRTQAAAHVNTNVNTVNNVNAVNPRIRIERNKDKYTGVSTTPGFDRFWTAYPKKKAKKDAQKAYDRVHPAPDELEQLLAALERAKQSSDWKKDGGKFIPHPATWLNGERWNDEDDGVGTFPISLPF